MSLAALARLEEAHVDLIGALDNDDVEAIERRVEELRSAITAVRAMGGWRQSADLKERAKRISQLGEAARVRVNFLTDLTRQRLELLSAARGNARANTYGISGRTIA
jgi:adenylosuccinate synthase